MRLLVIFLATVLLACTSGSSEKEQAITKETPSQKSKNFFAESIDKTKGLSRELSARDRIVADQHELESDEE